TPLTGLGILSPVRLPVSPPRRGDDGRLYCHRVVSVTRRRPRTSHQRRTMPTRIVGDARSLALGSSTAPAWLVAGMNTSAATPTDEPFARVANVFSTPAVTDHREPGRNPPVPDVPSATGSRSPPSGVMAASGNWELRTPMNPVETRPSLVCRRHLPC